MISIGDLHIQKEVLPLFDFTYNDFAKETLLGLLSEPLSSKEEILLRQDILKGFIGNLEIFKNYSYSRVDLIEVYTFLTNYYEVDISKKSFKRRLLFSKKKRHTTRSRYMQLVLLFHRLQTNYLQRMDTATFPEIYKKELQNISIFLNSFNLTYYEQLIREQRFKIKHLIELNKVIVVKAGKGEIEAFWKQYFLFESYLSVSKGIRKFEFTFPTFIDTGFSFKELYHPLLKRAVKNSFTINSNVVLLTGPNMSGKSTFLKALGLCVYLAHIGFGVSASEAQMPFFDSISTFINLNDDIINGYSHFMSEVMNLKRVVIEAADKKCFSVFDELFRGTNIEDAIEISTTAIKGLTRFKGSVFLISTHLHSLKEMEEVTSGIISTYCFDCALVDDTPIFNYQLKEGWSDVKVGQMLFEKEVLNKLLNQF